MPTEDPAARVFVFAHQDDEFGVLAWLEDFVARGLPVHCVYLTDGSARGNDPAVRDAESTRVLVRIGVQRERIVFLGTRNGIPDGALHQHLAKGFEALASVLRPLGRAALYIPAWEGGHHDHDCSHALGVLAARTQGLTEVAQYSLYNGAATQGAWFSVMRTLPANGPESTIRFSLVAALRYIRACMSYRSQWRTWLGLLPFYALRVLTGRSMALQPCSAARLRERPHGGPPLYYERRFRVPYDTVAQAVAACDRT